MEINKTKQIKEREKNNKLDVKEWKGENKSDVFFFQDNKFDNFKCEQLIKKELTQPLQI